MGKEIERKFLVRDASWRAGADAGLHCVQGYLCAGPPVSVRVRIMGGKATLTIKRALPPSPDVSGCTRRAVAREEFEYSIPIEDAEALLSGRCDGHSVEKTRHTLSYGGYVWEIDVFEGENAGLIVAEIELPSVDAAFERPPWLADEISHEPRYLNSCLSRKPFSQW